MRPFTALVLAASLAAGCPGSAPSPAPSALPAPPAASLAPASADASSPCGDGQDGSPVLARLGDVAVTRSDVAAAIDRLPPRARGRYVGAEPRQLLAQRIAEERALCLAAVARGADLAAVVARATEEAAATRFVDLVESAAVTDEAVRAYYDANPDRYQLEVIDVSHIVVPERPIAEAVLTELRAGAEFANLAMEHSVDSRSARAGGRLGWIAKGRMDPAWTQAAFALQPGEVSEPVRTAYGWALIRVHERKATQPLDEVRAGIERRLRQAASAELIAEVVGGARVVFEGELSAPAGTADPTP